MNNIYQQLAKLSPQQRLLFERRLQQRGVKLVQPQISRRKNDDELPLSFAQQRLWFIQQFEPLSSAYNVASALRLKGELKIAALEQALREIVARHETLRTSFVTNAVKQPIQVVAAPQFDLQVIDLHGNASPEVQLISDICDRPFDLTQSLLRVRLLRLHEDDHILVIATHHIISDRWSIGVFLSELSTLYNAFCDRQSSPLAELPIQYADWAIWQRQYLQGDVLATQAAYWQAQLQKMPLLELPCDRPRPANPTYQGAQYPLVLSTTLSKELRSLAAKAGTTLFTVLLAAFKVLLHRYTQQDDIAVGTDIANRDRPETAGLIGLLVNTVVLRTQVGDLTFRQLLRRVQQVVVDAIAHQDLPFEKLVEILNPDRNLSQMMPLFQVKFDLQLAAVKPLELQGLTVERLSLAEQTVKYELRLNLQDGECINGQVEYSTDLFDEATIARLVEHFQILLQGIVDNPDAQLWELPLLTPKEQLLLQPHLIQLDDDDLCIHHLLEAQVRQTPDAIALIDRHEYITYRELNARANQLAHYLHSLGVKGRVGVYLPRTSQLIVAILAVLKVGAACVPLDPVYPQARLDFIVDDADVSVLIHNTDLTFNSHIPTEIDLDGDWSLIAECSAEDLDLGICNLELAYLIYTSGSTGKPKGVAIAHRSTVALLRWANEVFTSEALAGVLAATSICFDLSIFEIFVPLSWGKKVVLVENILELPQVAPDTVTLINTVPSALAQLSKINAIPISVHTVNLAGEALPYSLVEQLRQLPHIQQIYNLYGPSEDTTYSTFACITDTIHIGCPIANTQVYVLDKYLQLVPFGVPGELYIAGAGLAQGYFNRPELTAEKFIPNPFNHSKFNRLYKTGDLVRYRPDGNLEFIGRLDQQVKIRGYRIEIGEIEAVLSQCSTVKEGVISVSEHGGDQRLVAYVVPNSDFTATALREFLAQKLPNYMIPSVVIELEKLPRLPNGKVDRSSLPEGENISITTNYVAPRTKVEKIIVQIWQSELDVTVGLHDNYFELGGHSLLAIKIIAVINETFSVDLPLRYLFENPTVAELASKIEQTTTRQAPTIKLTPDLVNRYQPFPLTDIQQAYWIGRNEAFALGNVATHGYREVETIGLSVTQVEKAWQQLIARHDMLRVVIQPDGQQRILPEVSPYEIKTWDLRDKPTAEATATLTNLRNRLSHQIFATDTYPLFDIQAVLLDDNKIRFFVSFDVLIGDAASLQVLGQEFVALMQSKSLPPLDISFRDYILVAIKIRNSETYQRSRDYWQNRLSTLPPSPQLPLQKTLAAVETPRFVRWSGTLASELWQKLKQQASQHNITPSGILLAAFTEILTRWSSPQFTLNLTLFNRLPLHPQVNQLVGDFTSSLLLAIDNSEQSTFIAKAQKIQAQLWEDLEHRHVSGVQVLRDLARLQQRQTGALMPVVFTSILTQTASNTNSHHSWQADVVYSLSQTSQVYLDHQVAEVDGTLVYNWDAIAELFPDGLLDEMFAAYSRLLEDLATTADWQAPTQLLPFTVDTPAATILSESPLHTLFFAQVTQNPHKQAVVTSTLNLTYQQLSDRVYNLAAKLQQLGVEPNQLVAVVMDKGWEQVVAVLGILTAGAAYVPIDPHPCDRALQLLQQAQVKYVVTQPWLDSAFADVDVTRICVGAVEVFSPLNPPLVGDLERLGSPRPLSLSPNSGGEDKEKTFVHGARGANPTDLAYVIYTSGSTGVPKGVAIDHQGAVNTILDINQRFGVTEQDWVLGLSSLTFDLSVYDIFGTLAAGATLMIPDADLAKDPAHWAELMQRYPITIWNSVPALMQLLIHSQPKTTNNLRLVLLSGDWIPLNLPQQIWLSFERAEIISLGGATEASIWSIFYPIQFVDPDWKSIPYGYPLTNQQIYVLNQTRDRCPTWVTGELYIGGVGLAKGYWGDREKTDESFITHPQTGERLYKTGDLGRYLPNGAIEFLGRADFQVKINGYRIELGEIEASLAQHPAIQAAVVTAVGEPQRLVAYVVPQVEQRSDFKLQQRGIRNLEALPSIELPQPTVNNAQIRRQSYRQFLQQPLDLAQFSQWMSSLAQTQIEGAPLPKYRYASAGSLYPVQTYLYVKENRIAGLSAGVYYYDPRSHRLILLAAEAKIIEQIYDSNQSIFAESAFSLFLIAELAAITPVYGDKARDFCLLEAGYISQLLMETAPDYDIGLCPIGTLEFASIEQYFDLTPSQMLLHSFVGGKIEPSWQQHWSVASPHRTLATSRETPPTRSIPERLRQYLQQKLPDYMIPSQYVLLDSLPLTANGKIDRRALPVPQLTATSQDYVVPRTEVEQAIATIWQNALNVEKIGIHDDFFELGGNSLSATQVITQMRHLGMELTIRAFFEAPTIAAQAQIQQQHVKPAKTIPKLARSIELIPNVEQMSDQDVEAMLAQMIAEEVDL
ncbi:non-ribosomal peptide synthetase (plasmid) [Gloeocapsa sp. PCC 7428]|uniref:non-ribosomal peptide synthetase n=1 Tax=Gloeocapsa sp. PCC 7428 TaxID=1173026 RepID=UPI0002A61587|nr:non-ribosomal peptide synthetase [Gloeocapsa sp. PCC 7428]AFZ33305.1 non-ribosomal peptide synthetase [Gloeocapsa sp. PCC 7428]